MRVARDGVFDERENVSASEPRREDGFAARAAAIARGWESADVRDDVV